MRVTLAASQAIEIGRKGENNVNKVVFPVYGWAELYGDGSFGLIHQRATDNDPYGCTVTVNDKFVEWVITSADVDVVGKGKCELRYINSDGMRVKSVVYETITRDSLGNNSLEPPEPWESWVDNVIDAGTNALEAADAAQGYAEAAQEAATNAESAVSTAFGQITASATTLAPGSSATASFNSTSKVMSFGIPRGADGSGDSVWGQQNGIGAYLPKNAPGPSGLDDATAALLGYGCNLSLIEDQNDRDRPAFLILPNAYIRLQTAAAGSTSYTTNGVGYKDSYGTDVSMMAAFKYAIFSDSTNMTFTEAKYPTSVVQNNDGTLTFTFAESLNPTEEAYKLVAGITLPDGNGLLATGNGIYNSGVVALIAGTVVYNTGANSVVTGQAAKNTAICSIVTGVRNRNSGERSAVFGSDNLNHKPCALVAGKGHNTTNGVDGVAVVGQYSDIGSNTAFAVGNGSDESHRSNAMEVTSLGEIKENGTKLSEKYEAKGKATVSGHEYSITRKALAITENGVTTTYYVADIT